MKAWYVLRYSLTALFCFVGDDNVSYWLALQSIALPLLYPAGAYTICSTPGRPTHLLHLLLLLLRLLLYPLHLLSSCPAVGLSVPPGETRNNQSRFRPINFYSSSEILIPTRCQLLLSTPRMFQIGSGRSGWEL